MKPPFPWKAAVAAAALYTAAFLVTTLLHEGGHALASKLLHGQPVLYNTHVESRNEHLPRQAEVAVALAGPVVSLLQGALVLLWVRREQDAGNGPLFRLYLGLFGVINFFGYLLTGPFVSYGDIGRAEALWQVPAWATIALAVAGGIGLHLVVSRTGPWFLRQGPGLARPVRGQLMRALVLVPWLLGSVLITALNWPLPTVLSLIYPPMSSMVLGAAYGGAMGAPYPVAAAEPPQLLPQLQLGWALGGLALVAALNLWLGQGLAF